MLGHEPSVALVSWPEYDEAKTVDDEIEIVVQVNGKVRSKLMLSRSASKDEMLEAAKNDEKIKSWIDGKTINGHVSVVEPLGSETQVYVSTSKAKVVGKIDPTVIPEPDEKVALIANMEKAKFFDIDTELTIR